MGLLQLVMILLAIGAVLWLVESAPFISATMKPIIRWVIVAITLLWLIALFVGDIPLPTLRR